MTKATAGVKKIRIGNLPAPSGSGKKRKRVGRGPGSGHGKTSTRGHKGQHSRAGSKHRSWFEGGQMPLQRRVPKRGFTNIFKKEFQIVNLSALSRALEKSEASAEKVISPQELKEMGLINQADLPVKILGGGEIKGTAVIQASAFSRTAKEKIEAAGGKVEVIKC